MDMQKSAASRVRHILQAMERSIDSARSRRVTDGGSGMPSTGIPVNSPRVPSSADNPLGRQAPAQPRLAIPGTQAGEARPMPSGTLIGGNPAAPRVQPAPIDPAQPARLKAKPKRFESTFAAQFPQPNQTAYRSQAG